MGGGVKNDNSETYLQQEKVIFRNWNINQDEPTNAPFG